MPREPKKLALLYILKILEAETDADHPLRQETIGARLAEDYGIVVERKAIGRNLALLAEAGYDVVSSPRGYYLGERLFESSEVRLLIDSVLCSRHINPHHSRELVERLAALAGPHFRSRSKNILAAEGRGKSENAELFYTIDVADEAIERGVQITFSYRKYGPDKKLRKSSKHTVSPYRMLLQNQHYYLMAYSCEYEKISYFRMDKITKISLTNVPSVPLRSLRGYENGIDYSRLSSSLPYMFGDAPVRVLFLATAEAIDHVVDWFGRDAEITPRAEGDFCVAVDVSPAAMEYWAMQYAKHVRILSPPSLRERVRDTLARALAAYTATEKEKNEEKFSLTSAPLSAIMKATEKRKEEPKMTSCMIRLSTIQNVRDFVDIVTASNVDVDLSSGRYVIDAKSIMGIFSLDLLNPIKLTAHAEDPALFEKLKPFIVE